MRKHAKITLADSEGTIRKRSEVLSYIWHTYTHIHSMQHIKWRIRHSKLQTERTAGLLNTQVGWSKARKTLHRSTLIWYIFSLDRFWIDVFVKGIASGGSGTGCNYLYVDSQHRAMQSVPMIVSHRLSTHTYNIMHRFRWRYGLSGRELLGRCR